jgi:hypothetical protein
MYTDYTWQDWEGTPEQARPALLLKIINGYKGSDEFKDGLTANAYFRGENPEIASKTLLKARVAEYEDAAGRKRKRTEMAEIAGNRIHSGIFFRFVTQQNQFLLSEGVTLPEENKNALGVEFDKELEWLGERALIQGVAWGFWNGDHLERIEAARDDLSGAVALLDEETSEPMALIQFWQIGASRPMYIRLYEVDGVSVYKHTNKLPVLVSEKRPYIMRTETDVLGTVTVGGRNYNRLPVRPLFANSEHRSELTQAIKSKIDLYDRVLSDFGDNLDRANDVYWVLNNFGGTLDEVAELLEQINRVKAVANMSDGSGAASSAEPHTIEVPYAARKEALDMLERALYQDYMALDMDELTGGSLTNVAIRAATANLNLKADRYEWQVRRFVKDILDLVGKPTDEIRFKRQTIANESETVADIAVMRDYIDQETALKLNPYIQQEEIPDIEARMATEKMNASPEPIITDPLKEENNA